MIRIVFLIVAAICGVVGHDAAALGSPPPPPADAPPSPIAFLQANDRRAQELLATAPADSLPAALRDTLKLQINQVFDFQVLSRLALGDHWDSRSPAQREHFVETFSAIIQEQNFDSFVRYYRDGEIRYVSEDVSGDSARVTAVVPLRNQEISIEYVARFTDSRWRVYDLVIDGVSTAEGNRRRYGRYIEKHSYDKLISQLDRQLLRLRGSND
jgi:phospholipid transport system substrate-binding protein